MMIIKHKLNDHDIYFAFLLGHINECKRIHTILIQIGRFRLILETVSKPNHQVHHHTLPDIQVSAKIFGRIKLMF